MIKIDARQTNSSSSSSNISEHVSPFLKHSKTCMKSEYFLSGVNLPLWTKELTVSQPVKQCYSGRTEHKSEPFTSMICLILRSLRLSPVLASNKTTESKFLSYLKSRNSTSVPGD